MSYQVVEPQKYPISKPNPDGPNYKSYSYSCSAIAPIPVNKISEEDYKKFKYLECSEFSSIFSQFFVSRYFSDFSYSPLIMSIIGKERLPYLYKFIEKYVFHLDKCKDKFEYTLENTVFNYNELSKNKYYIVSLSESYNDISNIIIDKNLPDFVKNEFILKIKEHGGLFIFLFDNKDENAADIFCNTFVRTFADFIIFDDISKSIFDSFAYIGCKTNVKIIVDDYLLVLDRTVLWNDFKAYRP
jgi:hypothetical protein